MVTKGKGKGGISWEIETDTYTLPCVKQITYKNLPHSLGNSTQNSVMAFMGK